MKITQNRHEVKIDYEKLGLTRGDKPAYYDSFLLKNDTSADKHPCIVVCPGGAYKTTADREAEPIAMQFMAAGFSAFILHYSALTARFPTALVELAGLIRSIRENADEYEIDPDRIAVIGFSAGGHLVASLGAFWNDPKICALAGCTGEESKPNGLILGYPVITGGEFAHRGSLNYLMGEDHTIQDEELFSLEKHVTSSFPKTFIWHTAADAGVPVENSLLLSMALSKADVPFELRVYPYGPHGISLANEVSWEQQERLIVPRAQSWIRDAISFTKDIAFSE